MNVAVNLGTYLTNAVNKFNSSKAAALDRMEKELYPDGARPLTRIRLAPCTISITRPTM